MAMKKNRRDTGFLTTDEMSPAARRRMQRGKRRPETFDVANISLDMEDKLISEALETYADDNWTESLRLKAEILEAEENSYHADEQVRMDRRERRNKVSRRERELYDREEQRIRENNRKIYYADNNKKIKKTEIPKDRLGYMLNNAQILTTGIFIGSLLVLNVLPYVLVAFIIMVLVLWVAVLRGSQSNRFKHRGFGKFCSSVTSILLLLGTYYCLMAFVILTSISGDSTSALNLSSETYSVYISGIDVYGDIDSSSRSDVNLITTVNPNTGQVLLTTTPRDYYVEIAGVSGDEKDKLTHAGNYGIDTSIATLEELYDIDIDFYIRINFTSFINIVDALGGVTIDSEIAFTTSENAGLVVDIVEGENHLNGEEALAFVRERYNLEGGDTQRAANQQIMLEAIFYEFLSPVTLVNLEAILECIAGEVETNMTTAQLQQLSRGILSSLLDTNIYSVAADGTADSAYCYSYSSNALSVIIPDQDSVDEIIGYMDDVAAGEDLPEE